jgi:hypothetical protein
MSGHEFIATAVGSLGFPIVAFWLMYQFATKTIEKNTKAIHELSIAMAQLKRKK